MVTKKKQSGKGVVSDAVKFARENRLLSRELGMIPHPAGQVASFLAKQAGYGHTSQVGNGFFTDFGNGLGGLAKGIGNGLFGGGKKKARASAILT